MKLRDPPRVVWIVLVELHVNNFIHQILLQLDELLLGECLVSISSEHVVHQTGVGGQQIGLVDISVAPVASNLVGETSDNVGELLLLINRSLDRSSRQNITDLGVNISISGDVKHIEGRLYEPDRGGQ